MKNYIISTGIIFLMILASPLSAQDNNTTSNLNNPYHKPYVKGGFDGSILSTATMDYPGVSGNVQKMGTLRYTLFFNMGSTVHYDYNNRVGIFTGLDLKNIGFIQKEAGITTKHRTYNIGVPLGIKLGNNIGNNYLFGGVGLDVPINYKEKRFQERSDKTKFNEWFSDRTPALMTYAFVGYSVRYGINLRLQYYFNNFMNPGYTVINNGYAYQPYAGYNIHIVMLSVGISLRYRTIYHVQGTKTHAVMNAGL